MSYCVNCGVKLEESLNKCPLCNTPVINPKGLKKMGLISPFPTKEGETGMEQGFDTTMAYPELANVPEFGSPEAAADVSKILVGTADDETNLDWLRGIAEDVRNSNDYQGDSIRRQLMASIPQLKKGGW